MVDQLLADHEPWEVAAAVREAAVAAVPTLDQLIGHLPAWQDADQRQDAAMWLDAHASKEQLAELAEYSNNPEHEPETRLYMPQLAGDYFTQTLEPSQLLSAWHEVIRPSPSDLTDQEWELLAPLLPRPKVVRRRNAELIRARSALNGIRYKLARNIPLSSMPTRYGSGTALANRHTRYIRTGVDRRMLKSLRSNPEASRLVEWLQTLDSEGDAPEQPALRPNVDAPSQPQPAMSEIRTWARSMGYKVGERGRIPAEVIERYQRAKSAS